MSKPLSVIPYFGGKARMSKFICDRLDYTTSTFVTLFGGACRVLLNKPPHKAEYYNDYGSGVCSLMSILSNKDTAQEFIDRLYYETEYSEEQFDKAKEIYDFCEGDFEKQYYGYLKKFLCNDKDIGISNSNVDEFISLLYELEKKDTISCNHCSTEIQESINNLKSKLIENEDFKCSYLDIFSMWVDLYDIKNDVHNSLARPRDTLTTDHISDMDLALATYIVFSFSFGSMGKDFACGKFKSDKDYKKRILNLYKCAERLEGINIMQCDAMDFFKQSAYGNDEKYKRIKENNILYEWLSNPDVMMFCDPSYISPKDEQRLLSGIDIAKYSSFSEAIKDKKQPKNLGACYTRSFGYEEQEYFLMKIKDAKCKTLICNYDLKLYDKYLTPELGWTKEVYPTTSNVALHSSDNTRLECIWYNY